MGLIPPRPVVRIHHPLYNKKESMNIKVFGQDELLKFIQTHDVSDSVCISISDPPARFYHPFNDNFDPLVLKPKFADTLVLRFHDVDQKFIVGTPLFCHAEKMLSFIKKYKNTPIYIHCFAGVSRSAAAGLAGFMLECGDENQALKKLISIRPCISPNTLLVKYFDQLLGSDLMSHVVAYKKTLIEEINEDPYWGVR